jgi:hypothetical protein
MDPMSIPAPGDFLSRADRLAIAVRCAGAFRLTDVEPTGINWLWPGRIPLGHVTLLVSDPGAGKSLLALDIAARVSRGAPWPDHKAATAGRAFGEEGEGGRKGDSIEHEWDISTTSYGAPNPQSEIRNPKSPASVLLLTIEDHFATTVRPRLEALGADCSRIMALSHVPGEDFFDTPRPFALNRDLNRLSILIRALADCRLVILDPITAFLGDTSDQCNSDVWKLLSALTHHAEEQNFAVLAVSHLRKKEGAAIHRALGSLAFIANARTAWTIAKDPADPNRRLLVPLKNNLAPDASGLAFNIESNVAGSVPVIRWLPGAIETRADTLLASQRRSGRPDDDRRYAVQWLRQRLSAGASPVREIRNDADAHGISYATLRRGFRELGCEAIRLGPVPKGEWQWKLPAEDAQNGVGEFCAPTAFTDEFAPQHPAPDPRIRHLAATDN